MKNLFYSEPFLFCEDYSLRVGNFEVKYFVCFSLLLFVFACLLIIFDCFVVTLLSLLLLSAPARTSLFLLAFDPKQDQLTQHDTMLSFGGGAAPSPEPPPALFLQRLSNQHAT